MGLFSFITAPFRAITRRLQGYKPVRSRSRSQSAKRRLLNKGPKWGESAKPRNYSPLNPAARPHPSPPKTRKASAARRPASKPRRPAPPSKTRKNNTVNLLGLGNGKKAMVTNARLFNAPKPKAASPKRQALANVNIFGNWMKKNEQPPAKWINPFNTPSRSKSKSVRNPFA